jgi:CRP-like cAMP-binding protein
LLRNVLRGLDDAQIARLLAAGKFCDVARGATLAEENKPLDRLFFICEGRAQVTIAGRLVSELTKGNFVGEVAFLTNRPATATVTADSDVRVLVFGRENLDTFFRNDTDIAGLIYQLLGRELALKIKVSNDLVAAVGQPT